MSKKSNTKVARSHTIRYKHSEAEVLAVSILGSFCSKFSRLTEKIMAAKNTSEYQKRANKLFDCISLMRRVLLSPLSWYTDDEDTTHFNPQNAKLVFITSLTAKSTEMKFRILASSVLQRAAKFPPTSRPLFFFPALFDAFCSPQPQAFPAWLTGIRDMVAKPRVEDKMMDRSVCGRQITRVEVAFYCSECSLDPTAFLCHRCFDPSLHEGHNWSARMIQGICDCGQCDAIARNGFCPRHGHPEDCPELPTDLLFILRRYVAIILRAASFFADNVRIGIMNRIHPEGNDQSFIQRFIHGRRMEARYREMDTQLMALCLSLIHPFTNDPPYINEKIALINRNLAEWGRAAGAILLMNDADRGTTIESIGSYWLPSHSLSVATGLADPILKVIADGLMMPLPAIAALCTGEPLPPALIQTVADTNAANKWWSNYVDGFSGLVDAPEDVRKAFQMRLDDLPQPTSDVTSPTTSFVSYACAFVQPHRGVRLIPDATELSGDSLDLLGALPRRPNEAMRQILEMILDAIVDIQYRYEYVRAIIPGSFRAMTLGTRFRIFTDPTDLPIILNQLPTFHSYFKSLVRHDSVGVSNGEDSLEQISRLLPQLKDFRFMLDELELDSVHAQVLTEPSALQHCDYGLFLSLSASEYYLAGLYAAIVTMRPNGREFQQLSGPITHAMWPGIMGIYRGSSVWCVDKVTTARLLLEYNADRRLSRWLASPQEHLDETTPLPITGLPVQVLAYPYVVAPMYDVPRRVMEHIYLFQNYRALTWPGGARDILFNPAQAPHLMALYLTLLQQEGSCLVVRRGVDQKHTEAAAEGIINSLAAERFTSLFTTGFITGITTAGIAPETAHTMTSMDFFHTALRIVRTHPCRAVVTDLRNAILMAELLWGAWYAHSGCVDPDRRLSVVRGPEEEPVYRLSKSPVGASFCAPLLHTICYIIRFAAILWGISAEDSNNDSIALSDIVDPSVRVQKGITLQNALRDELATRAAFRAQVHSNIWARNDENLPLAASCSGVSEAEHLRDEESGLHRYRRIGISNSDSEFVTLQILAAQKPEATARLLAQRYEVDTLTRQGQTVADLTESRTLLAARLLELVLHQFVCLSSDFSLSYRSADPLTARPWFEDEMSELLRDDVISELAGAPHPLTFDELSLGCAATYSLPKTGVDPAIMRERISGVLQRYATARVPAALDASSVYSLNADGWQLLNPYRLHVNIADSQAQIQAFTTNGHGVVPPRLLDAPVIPTGFVCPHFNGACALAGTKTAVHLVLVALLRARTENRYASSRNMALRLLLLCIFATTPLTKAPDFDDPAFKTALADAQIVDASTCLAISMIQDLAGATCGPITLDGSADDSGVSLAQMLLDITGRHILMSGCETSKPDQFTAVLAAYALRALVVTFPAVAAEVKAATDSGRKRHRHSHKVNIAEEARLRALQSLAPGVELQTLLSAEEDTETQVDLPNCVFCNQPVHPEDSTYLADVCACNARAWHNAGHWCERLAEISRDRDAMHCGRLLRAAAKSSQLGTSAPRQTLGLCVPVALSVKHRVAGNGEGIIQAEPLTTNLQKMRTVLRVSDKLGSQDPVLTDGNFLIHETDVLNSVAFQESALDALMTAIINTEIHDEVVERPNTMLISSLAASQQQRRAILGPTQFTPASVGSKVRHAAKMRLCVADWQLAEESMPQHATGNCVLRALLAGCGVRLDDTAGYSPEDRALITHLRELMDSTDSSLQEILEAAREIAIRSPSFTREKVSVLPRISCCGHVAHAQCAQKHLSGWRAQSSIRRHPLFPACPACKRPYSTLLLATHVNSELDPNSALLASYRLLLPLPELFRSKMQSSGEYTIHQFWALTAMLAGTLNTAVRTGASALSSGEPAASSLRAAASFLHETGHTRALSALLHQLLSICDHIAGNDEVTAFVDFSTSATLSDADEGVWPPAGCLIDYMMRIVIQASKSIQLDAETCAPFDRFAAGIVSAAAIRLRELNGCDSPSASLVAVALIVLITSTLPLISGSASEVGLGSIYPLAEDQNMLIILYDQINAVFQLVEGSDLSEVLNPGNLLSCRDQALGRLAAIIAPLDCGRTLPQNTGVELHRVISSTCRSCGAKNRRGIHVRCLRCGEDICIRCTDIPGQPSEAGLDAAAYLGARAAGGACNLIPFVNFDSPPHLFDDGRYHGLTLNAHVPRRAAALVAHAANCGGLSGCLFYAHESTGIFSITPYGSALVGTAHTDSQGCVDIGLTAGRDVHLQPARLMRMRLALAADAISYLARSEHEPVWQLPCWTNWVGAHLSTISVREALLHGHFVPSIDGRNDERDRPVYEDLAPVNQHTLQVMTPGAARDYQLVLDRYIHETMIQVFHSFTF